VVRPSRDRCGSSCDGQSRFDRHSAHIGQELEIYYRWDPLFGRKVRFRDSEQRGNGCVIHVDDSSGAVRVVSAWMLDPVACVSMKLGEPRVAVAALRELHSDLQDRLRARTRFRTPRKRRFILDDVSAVAVHFRHH
jgi:hypothetical protein